uniref:KRAB-A domain-containing protein 2 n=1 Tax=Lygus hesperus TaxID=30085 RepID=A0A146KV27_LYGHE
MHSKEKLVSKREFDKTINDCTRVRKKETTFFITRAKYKQLLGQVKSARKKKANELHPRLAKLVKKYDVITVDGVERLVVPSSTSKLIYVAKDELYAVISQVHLDTDHGKLPTMTKFLKTKYKNVSNEAITAYLKLCQKCQKDGSKAIKVSPKKDSPKGRRGRRKKEESKEEDDSKENKEEKISDDRKPKKRGRKPKTACKEEQVSGPIPAKKPKIVKRTRATLESASTKPLTAGTRTPQRIDFIEMMHGPDYDYNFIVVLRESTTKFVHLRPLRSRSPEELAEVLLPIFICFGTPSILETSNQDFMQTTINSLCEKYPTVPSDILVEGTDDCQFFADIETLMLTWVCENSSQKWYNGLRFIQYIANLYFNKEIGKTPFEAMFGRKGKLDVSSLSLPAELLEGLCPAQDGDQEERETSDQTEILEEDERGLEINEMLEVVLNDEG